MSRIESTFEAQLKEFKVVDASRSLCEEQILDLQGGGAPEGEPDSAVEDVAGKWNRTRT